MGSEKNPPPVNDRAIDAGEFFLDLYLQHGGGTQRPLKPPRYEAAFLVNDLQLLQTEPDG